MGGKSELDDNVSFTGSADRRNTEASTNSSEGTQLICQSPIRRVDQEKRVDDVLKSESSSSNSSLAVAPNQSEIKKQPEISVEIKPFGGQASSDTSQLTEQLCSQKTKQAESVVSSEERDGCREADHQEQKSPRLRANNEQGPNLCGFDLNEDLEMNDEPVSLYPVTNVAEPIAVVARIGVPNGLRFALPRFDGETGWRSAPTSAFRPALPSKSLNDSNANPSPGLRDFDLNIAASVDGSEMDSDPEKSGKLSLNLSCRGKSLLAQPKSRNRGFDLNDMLLIDQDQSKQLEKASARQSNLQGVRPAYWVDLGSMPAFTHVQGQPFIVAAPMFPSAEPKQTHVPIQPTMALGPNPPSGYYIGPGNGLSYSQSFLPNPGFQYGLSGAPTSQIPSSLLAAAYPGGLNHLQATTGQGGFAAMRPGLLLNGEVSASGSQAAAFPGLAYKRREPEGGWDCNQINQRRAGAWK